MNLLRNLLFVITLFTIASCKKGELLSNQAPDTQIFVKQINLTGTDRLNTVVGLHWSGTDKDGYVTSYELSFDNATWKAVTVQDSVFRFSIDAGSDTSDINFYVRAVDDAGQVDLSPAFLRVPIKNTPPQIAYKADLLPSDTVKCIISLAWNVTDVDGDETIDSVLIKINNGSWFNVKKSATTLSIVPDDATVTGSTGAKVYYNADDSSPQSISGLRLQDTNRIYMKAVDIANSSSAIDTSEKIFVTNKTGDLLVIGGNNIHPEAFYFNILNTVYPSYDFVDYTRSNGKFQPKFWNTEFELLLRLYDRSLIYLDETPYIDALSGQSRLILESAATALQNYLDKGGKAFISAKFPIGFSANSSVFQAMPVDSLSSSSGQAYLTMDSLVVAQVTPYPNLKPSEFILSLDPFYPSADADVLYKAQLSKNGGWVGPKNIAARRKLNGKTNLVFFSVELHKLNGIPSATQTLFDQVINNEFNW